MSSISAREPSGLPKGPIGSAAYRLPLIAAPRGRAGPDAAWIAPASHQYPRHNPRSRPGPGAGAVAILAGLGLAGPGLGHLLLLPIAGSARATPGRPRQLELVAIGRGTPTREVVLTRCDDPVYGAGLRVLLPPSRPLVVIP